jgi:hypothetical protein
MVTRRAQSEFIPASSGLVLAEVLEEGGETAEKIRAAVHRTMLWRFTTGRGVPDADTIATLHDLSDGRIAANGWGRSKTGTEG